MLYDAEDYKEESSLGHEGESLLLDLSESSDNNYEDANGTSAKENNCNGNGNGDGGGDRNTGSRGGSMEWLRFLSQSAQMEALGAMAKAESSSLTASRKYPKLEQK